jgi:hypothetical protein
MYVEGLVGGGTYAGACCVNSNISFQSGTHVLILVGQSVHPSVGLQYLGWVW